MAASTNWASRTDAGFIYTRPSKLSALNLGSGTSRGTPTNIQPQPFCQDTSQLHEQMLSSVSFFWQGLLDPLCLRPIQKRIERLPLRSEDYPLPMTLVRSSQPLMANTLAICRLLRYWLVPAANRTNLNPHRLTNLAVHDDFTNFLFTLHLSSPYTRFPYQIRHQIRQG
jgi:hypothetical protein